MKIESNLQSFYNTLPSAKTVAKSAVVMATAAIALEALSSITAAEAGPITYGICIAACAGTSGPFLPFCVGACLPLLAAPSP